MKIPIYECPVTSSTIEIWWISGFFTQYCSFTLSADIVAGAFGGDEYYRYFCHQFSVGFNIECLCLVKIISEVLDIVYYVRKNGERVDLKAQSYYEAVNLIEFFQLYPLQSNKQHAAFEIWREFVYSLSTNKRNRARLQYFFKLIDQLNKINCS